MDNLCGSFAGSLVVSGAKCCKINNAQAYHIRTLLRVFSSTSQISKPWTVGHFNLILVPEAAETNAHVGPHGKPTLAAICGETRSHMSQGPHQGVYHFMMRI